MDRSTVSLSIGVLAIQGDFVEHIRAIKKAVHSMNMDQEGDYVDVDVFEIRDLKQINNELDGLIIPGGESTVMNKYIKENGYLDRLVSWVHMKNKFTWGTCAGLILLSNRVLDNDETIGGLDISCSRNSYGRQTESFEASLSIIHPELRENFNSDSYSGIFIRAPRITSVDSDDVTVLCSLLGDSHKGDSNNAVAVRQRNIMACTFHPELSDDLSWQKYFIKQVISHKFVASC